MTKRGNFTVRDVDLSRKNTFIFRLHQVSDLMKTKWIIFRSVRKLKMINESLAKTKAPNHKYLTLECLIMCQFPSQFPYSESVSGITVKILHLLENISLHTRTIFIFLPYLEILRFT